MMKVEKIDLTNLPSDVVSNIASFMVGEPEYLRLKHNEALKKIQKKYKIEYLGPRRKRRRRKTTLEFCITRDDLLFSKESVSHIIPNQEDRILDMFFNEVDTDDEDNEPRMFLSVNAQGCARMSGTHYEDKIHSYCDFSTPLIPTTVDDILDDLIVIAEDIEDQIRIEHDKIDFTSFGIQAFEFKLVLK